jgi:hypothetical protein
MQGDTHECFTLRFQKGGNQVENYFVCKDCKITWVCLALPRVRSCAVVCGRVVQALCVVGVLFSCVRLSRCARLAPRSATRATQW